VNTIRIARSGARGSLLAALLAPLLSIVILLACLAGVASAIVPQAELLAPDAVANDLFGGSVAVWGGTAVMTADNATVGANVRQGAAYVFVRSGAAWTFQGKLTAADGAADDHFGNAVAIYGDTVVVGASADTVAGHVYQGSAYVFTRSGTTWSQQTKLTGDDATSASNFGRAVAVYGDTVVAGAIGDDAAAANAGAAYVFTRSGTTWSQQAKLTANDAGDGDNLGNAVAISGGTAVIGSYRDTIGADYGQGSAYVFSRSGATWTQQKKFTRLTGEAWDQFGTSVAISGTTVLVGAPSENILTGAAYVYVRTGTTWALQKRLVAPDGHNQDQFGCSVGLGGNTAVIGADQRTSRGGAYVFMRNGTSWTRRTVLVRPDPGPYGDRFGCSVGISGGTVLVGSYLALVGANNQQGAAYVWADIVAPRVRSLTPAHGAVGTTVTITGLGFRAKRGTSKVYFGSKAATKYVLWSDSRIKVKVPSIGVGKRSVRVRTALGRSNALTFKRD